MNWNFQEFLNIPPRVYFMSKSLLVFFVDCRRAIDHLIFLGSKPDIWLKSPGTAESYDPWNECRGWMWCSERFASKMSIRVILTFTLKGENLVGNPEVFTSCRRIMMMQSYWIGSWKSNMSGLTKQVKHEYVGTENRRKGKSLINHIKCFIFSVDASYLGTVHYQSLS